VRRALPLLLCAMTGAGTLVAQSDPRVQGAIQLAQDGHADSARARLAALERTLPPGDSAWADVLYGQAVVAGSADEARQRLQRVVVEYPLAPVADDATLRLAQLEYASVDGAAALRHLERFRGDHAASPLVPTAAAWAARVQLQRGDSTAACAWVQEGLGRVGDDAALRSELAGLGRRCRGGAPAPAATARTAAPPTATTPSYRIQVVAAGSAADAERELARARKAGFDGSVVQEGPYHKVRLGRYATQAQAQAAVAAVRGRLGGKPFVVREP
jgi:hypothetical protein